MPPSSPNQSMQSTMNDISFSLDPIEIECMEEILKISIYYLAEKMIPKFESKKNKCYFANLRDFCTNHISSSNLTQLIMSRMCLQAPMLQQRKEDLQNRNKIPAYTKPKEIEENMQ